MALFKVYHGDRSNLPGELKDSYGYVVVDENPGVDIGTWTPSGEQALNYGLGEWFIDVQPDENTLGKRYRIAAISLVDEEAGINELKYYTLADLVKLVNLTDDIVGASWDSNNNSSKFDTTLQLSLRSSIDVAKKNDSISKAYVIELTNNDWAVSLEDSSYIETTIEISTTDPLHCGAISALNAIPPSIIYSSGPKEAYDAIVKASLNDNRTSMTFTMKATDLNKLTSTLSLIIIDYR